MDNVFIFDEALTDAQIDEIRQNGQSGIESVAGIPSPYTPMLFGIGLVALFRRQRQRGKTAVGPLLGS